MQTPSWEPGTQYNYEDIVEYQGKTSIQDLPTSSISVRLDPSRHPGPWGQLVEDSVNEYHQQQQLPEDQPKPQPYFQPPQQQPLLHDQDHQGQGSEEKTHQWYEDEETKKKLEIGGGLVAGAALLAGGMLGYKNSQEHKEEMKDRISVGADVWLSEAKQRTEAYRNYGTQEPCIWILTEGKNIPKGAILVGREKSWNLYTCRAYLDGGIQLGKASDVFKEGGVLGYKNEEIHISKYEVLIGDMNRLRWVSVSGRLNVASLGCRPVEAGHENDGTPLYIAEAHHHNAVHPGKASEKFNGAYIPYDGKELNIKEYRVLCYNN